MKLPDIETMEIEKGTSLWSNSWYRLKQNRLAMVGLVILIFMVFVSLLTPWIAPYSYEAQDLNLGAVSPSAKHWLGTDTFGRDMLTRIMYGSRVSLAVGFLATVVSLIIGVTWGTISGYDFNNTSAAGFLPDMKKNIQELRVNGMDIAGTEITQEIIHLFQYFLRVSLVGIIYMKMFPGVGMVERHGLLCNCCKTFQRIRQD